MTVQYYVYDSKMKKAEIITDMLEQKYITVEDDIDFDLDKVNNNRNDAQFWCDKFGEPKFVTAYLFKKLIRSHRTIRLEAKLSAIREAFTEDLKNGEYNMYAQTKKKFPVCPKCGSKISRIFMETQHKLVDTCPVCKARLTNKMKQKCDDRFERQMMVDRDLRDSLAMDYAKAHTYWLIRVEK